MFLTRKKKRPPIRIVSQVDSLSPGDAIRIGGEIFYFESFKDTGELKRIVLSTTPRAKTHILEYG